MSTVLRFLRGHALTLALLAGSIVFVSWIVQTQRHPGAMTIVEAQAMDMTAMKPPPGVYPVAVEGATVGSVGSAQTFPAEVLAYNDEDVVARVPGLVAKILVYPGDKVRAGQLLAVLSADEIAQQALEARLRAASKASDARAVSQEYEEARNMVRKTRSDLAMRIAALDRSEVDRSAAAVEWDKSRRELEEARSDIDRMKAELRYADQEHSRSQRLHSQGAISLDELQAAQRERDSASAKVRGAEAKAKSSELSVSIAEKKLESSKKMVAESRAAVDSAQAEVAASEAALKRHDAHENAAREEAQAMRALAGGADTLAGYRNLRALSNGVVSERTVSPGTSVMPGQVVLKLKVAGKVRVQAQLPQGLASGVTIGTAVEVVTAQGPIGARITSVFPVVAPDSRTFRVEAVVDNAKGLLMTGMFARLRLTGAAEEVIAIRASAVRTDLDGAKYVWVAAERKDSGKPTDWTCTMHPEVSNPGPGICSKCKMDLTPREGTSKLAAEKRNVVLGSSDGRSVAVLSGLKSGDRVIWAGHEDLYPGAPVEPVEWTERGPKALPAAPGSSASGGSESGHAGHGGG